MEYALLIYSDECTVPDMPEPQREELMAAYRAFNESVRAAGSWRGSVKLTGTGSATSVKVRDGKILTTDGPFAETKEQLAGLYVVDCENLDDALERVHRASRHHALHRSSHQLHHCDQRHLLQSVALPGPSIGLWSRCQTIRWR